MGIYAVTIRSENFPGDFTGMMSIGTNPTVGGKQRTIEVNIFDFNKEIYNTNLIISFITRLRNEVKFDTLEEMISQLAKDKIDAIEVLKKSL